jgi:hypothetical protein
VSARHLLARPDFTLAESERPDDVLFMIDLLAAWMRLRGNRLVAGVSVLSATILCPIFRSEKGAGYQEAADNYRRQFSGIAERPIRAGEFLARARPAVWEVMRPADVFVREFSDFFDDRF